MSARPTVLNWLSRRVGFPFSEAELSPTLRRKVGEISDLKQEMDVLSSQAAQKQEAVTMLRSRKTSQTTWMIISIIVGAILLIFIIGAIFLVAAYLLYRRRAKTGRLIQERTVEIANLRAENVTLSNSLDAKLSALAPEIFNELSTIHQVRTVSVSGQSTVQLVKETIREVVMVPCVYCHTLIPQTSPRCPQCGATRKS